MSAVPHQGEWLDIFGSMRPNVGKGYCAWKPWGAMKSPERQNAKRHLAKNVNIYHDIFGVFWVRRLAA